MRYNSRIITFILLKCTSQWFCCTYKAMQPSPLSNATAFHYPKGNPMPISHRSLLPLLLIYFPFVIRKKKIHLKLLFFYMCFEQGIHLPSYTATEITFPPSSHIHSVPKPRVVQHLNQVPWIHPECPLANRSKHVHNLLCCMFLL